MPAAIFERNGRARPWTDQPVGTPEDVAEALAPFVEIGYRHLIAGFPSPYDEESMTRLATEVRPLLERALGAIQLGWVGLGGERPLASLRAFVASPVAGRLGAIAAGRHVAPATARGA